jgi:valyl-tRNA synthetase
MVVPKCSRSGDIIEPLSVPQWFCNCDSMAKKAVDVVRSGVFWGALHFCTTLR